MKINYDEVSPITGNMSVLVEGDMKLCMETGYHTYSSWNKTENGHQLFEQGSSEVVVGCSVVDWKNGNSQVWFPITMMTEVDILEPKKTNHHLKWSVNSFRLKKDSDSPELLVMIKNDLTYVINPDEAVLFDKFEDAYNEFNKVKNGK